MRMALSLTSAARQVAAGDPIAIEAHRIAILRGDAGLFVHRPEGAGQGNLRPNPTTPSFIFDPDLELDLWFDNVPLDGDDPGVLLVHSRMEFDTRKRFLGERSRMLHPVLELMDGKASKDTFCEALRVRLNEVLSGPIESALRKVPYESCSTKEEVGDALTDLAKGPVAEQLSDMGLIPVSFTLTALSCPEADARREQEARLTKERRERELRAAHEDLEHDDELKRLRREHETALEGIQHENQERVEVEQAQLELDRVKMDRERMEAEHRSALTATQIAEEKARIDAELDRIRTRRKQAHEEELRKIEKEHQHDVNRLEVLKKEAEVRALELENQLKERRQREFDELGKTEAKLAEQVERLNQQIAALVAAQANQVPPPAPPPADGLAAKVAWRAVDPGTCAGTQRIISDRLTNYAELESWACLDVTVECSEPAYVYVLLHGPLESGHYEWMCFLPEGVTEGIQNGIPEGANHQSPGRTYTWPGVNRRMPCLPYWQLDDNPGLERWVVVASREKLDIAGMLATHAVDEFVSTTARFTSRGAGTGTRFRPPGQGEQASKPYSGVLSMLHGKDTVVHELVIRHVRAKTSTGV